MLDDYTKKDVENCIDALETLTKEYKLLFASKEYQMGKKVYLYLQLLKKRKLFSIIKRLFKSSKKQNQFLNMEEISKEKNIWSKNRIAVYTAVFGNYDNVKSPVIKPNNIDYYIITDQPLKNIGCWTCITVNNLPEIQELSNTEKNRYFKIFPNKLFEDYEYSIYLDGNVFVTSDLTPLIQGLSTFPISMHRHKNRDCVYEEIDACIAKMKAPKEELLRHKKLLESHKVPHHGGLLEATLIARKHNDPLCITLMEQWWNEFMEYSKRDQISLIDILWKENIDISALATMGNNTFTNNSFVILSHK